MERRPDPPPDHTGLAWFLAGYVGIAGFLGLEAATRERGAATSLETSSDDQGTTRLIVSAFGSALLLAPVLRTLRLRRLPPGAARMGLVLEVGGLGLRAWSMRTLRGSYSRTLRTEDAQAVIESGPYRLVRHPGYLGSLLTWAGFALTSRSVPVVESVAALLGRAYRRRIAAEEQLLRRDLPAYGAYSARTKRLLPFVW